MIVSIHQPDYIPYLGFFYKISRSDYFVFLDDCQFSNDNMHHWNTIKTPQGECRLKIPVEQHLGDSINRVRTKDELGWKEKHLRTLEMSYKRAPYFQSVYPQFAALLSRPYPNLAELNITIDKWISDGFGFRAVFSQSSNMEIGTVREERVIDICVSLGADEYLSGNGARAYQRREHFSERGVHLVYTDYRPFEYRQLWKGFCPNLSVLDYLFNYGFDWETAERRIRG